MLFRTFTAAAVLILVATSASVAQTDRSFPACPSQDQMQQVIGSGGKYVPEDCRRLTVTRIRSGTTDFCLLDFETSGDPGFLDKLRSAAVPTKWWVACENLGRF